jgi:hypothetical protein
MPANSLWQRVQIRPSSWRSAAPMRRPLVATRGPPPVVINTLIAGTTSTVSPLTNQTGATPGIAPSTPTTPGNTRTRPKPKLIRSNKEIDMSETFLGRYAAVKKRNAVAAILDFTDEEWESLKALKEANAAEMSQAAVANDIDNNSGALGMKNKTIGGTIDKGMA